MKVTLKKEFRIVLIVCMCFCLFACNKSNTSKKSEKSNESTKVKTTVKDAQGNVYDPQERVWSSTPMTEREIGIGNTLVIVTHLPDTFDSDTFLQEEGFVKEREAEEKGCKYWIYTSKKYSGIELEVGTKEVTIYSSKGNSEYTDYYVEVRFSDEGSIRAINDIAWNGYILGMKLQYIQVLDTFEGLQLSSSKSGYDYVYKNKTVTGNETVSVKMSGDYIERIRVNANTSYVKSEELEAYEQESQNMNEHIKKLRELTEVARKYFDMINTLGVDAAYSQYYDTDLLSSLGYYLSPERLNSDVVSLYNELGGKGKFVLESWDYKESGEYFILNIQLKTDVGVAFKNLTYTIRFDEQSNAYKLLDFDVEKITEQGDRLSKKN